MMSRSILQLIFLSTLFLSVQSILHRNYAFNSTTNALHLTTVDVEIPTINSMFQLQAAIQTIIDIQRNKLIPFHVVINHYNNYLLEIPDCSRASRGLRNHYVNIQLSEAITIQSCNLFPPFDTVNDAKVAMNSAARDYGLLALLMIQDCFSQQVWMDTEDRSLALSLQIFMHKDLDSVAGIALGTAIERPHYDSSYDVVKSDFVKLFVDSKQSLLQLYHGLPSDWMRVLEAIDPGKKFDLINQKFS